VRVLCAFAISLAFLVKPLAVASDPEIRSIPLFGKDHVDLEDWACANRFECVWKKKSGEVLLTNSWARLGFRVDSRRAQINGIDVWLSHPIARQLDSVYITEFDLETIIDPILHPPKGPKGRKVKTIAISAGHGGRDPGNLEGHHQEKKYTLLLARELEKRLEQAGLKVVLIRDGDEYVDLEQRPALARRRGADLFLSVHYNSAGRGNNEARGVEVYCLTPAGATSTNGSLEPSGKAARGNRFDDQNVLFAYQVQKALVNSLDMVDRGVRRARFLVLRQADIPAILVEAGFMSHPEEMKKIASADHRRATAQAIVDGVLAYKRLVER
jgi:N-acetylmuramoyl-L-alanine amidase